MAVTRQRRSAHSNGRSQCRNQPCALANGGTNVRQQVGDLFHFFSLHSLWPRTN